MTKIEEGMVTLRPENLFERSQVAPRRREAVQTADPNDFDEEESEWSGE